jgi:hypothetical protein
VKFTGAGVDLNAAPYWPALVFLGSGPLFFASFFLPVIALAL